MVHSRKATCVASSLRGSSLLLGALLLATGCGSSVFHATVAIAKYPADDPRKVEIYRSSAPRWPYEVIGEFVFHSQQRDLFGVFDDIRERAAYLGAHGVIGLQREVWIEGGMRPQGDPFHAAYRGKLVRRK